MGQLFPVPLMPYVTSPLRIAVCSAGTQDAGSCFKREPVSVFWLLWITVSISEAAQWPSNFVMHHYSWRAYLVTLDTSLGCGLGFALFKKITLYLFLFDMCGCLPVFAPWGLGTESKSFASAASALNH